MRIIVAVLAIVALCGMAVQASEAEPSLSPAETQLREQYGVISAELRGLEAESIEALVKQAELTRIAASIVKLAGVPSADSVEGPVFPLVRLAREIVAAAEADEQVATDSEEGAVESLGIDNNSCPNRAGTCRSTSSGCSGSFVSGLCPGAASIKCCIPNSSCSSRSGTCQHTGLGCGGSWASGLCPGSTSIKCCLPGGSSIPTSACPNRAGTCKSTSSGCSGGSFVSGLCPGAADNKCCIPNSVCSSRGGTCQSTGNGCGGTWATGLCPGSASIKCCLPGGGGGSCGPYSNAAIINMVGNGNRNYGVVKIATQHLSNPSIASSSPYNADNTMIKSTACAFSAMHDAAKRAGVTITINSAFRCLARQEYFWNCYITKKCNNGNLAAKPGTSNHGVGLALDLNSGGAGVYNWLKKNGHAHGFVRTVPSETWHWEHRPGTPPAPYT